MGQVPPLGNNNIDSENAAKEEATEVKFVEGTSEERAPQSKIIMRQKIYDGSNFEELAAERKLHV